MDYYYMVFLPVTMGIGGVMTFLFIERWHKLYDKVHIALMVCSIITVYIVVRALVVGTVDYTYVCLDNLEQLTALSICPLFYLYFRAMTHDNKWHHWYWWLFAPAVVLTLSNIILGIIVGWDRIISAQLNGFYPLEPTAMTLAEKLFMFSDVTLLNITVIVMAVVLIGLSAHHLYMYHKHAENYYANLEESCFDNMNRFLVCAILFLLVIFVVTCFMREINEAGSDIILAFALCLSVIFVVMLYNALRIRVTDLPVETIVLLQQSEVSAPAPESETERLLDKKIPVWESRKDKPYCKEGLTLVALAKELGVSRQALSVYINTHRGMNFNRWINTLRIEEAKRLLISDSVCKLGYISAICGFSAQSSFNRTFRAIDGRSPQQYREEEKL